MTKKRETTVYEKISEYSLEALASTGGGGQFSLTCPRCQKFVIGKLKKSNQEEVDEL